FRRVFDSVCISIFVSNYAVNSPKRGILAQEEKRRNPFEKKEVVHKERGSPKRVGVVNCCYVSGLLIKSEVEYVDEATQWTQGYTMDTSFIKHFHISPACIPPNHLPNHPNPWRDNYMTGVEKAEITR
ncbi:hypothetical protein RYX36_001848, partial [Vicia faba]